MQPSARDRWLVVRLRYLAWLGGAAALAGALGAWHWSLELFSHFIPYYLLLCVLGVLVARRMGECLLFAAASVVLVLWSLWPLRFELPEPLPNAAPLRVVSANLWVVNHDYALANRVLADADAELLFLTEATPAWQRALAPLQRSHPYGCSDYRDTPFGLALLARQPLKSCTVQRWPELASYPLLRAQLPDGRVLYGVHPPPPLGGELAALRDRYLNNLARQLRGETAPVLVLGDFNITPWSPRYLEFRAAANLSELGQGLWPSWGPLPALPLLPLDRALGRGVVARQVALGPNIGSDHRPLLVELE